MSTLTRIIVETICNDNEHEIREQRIFSWDNDLNNSIKPWEEIIYQEISNQKQNIKNKKRMI